MIFASRRDAGQRLAELLVALRPERPIVLALARGGVPVGFEIARALRAPLDIVLVRKIGAPGHEELAIGAVADGGKPELVIDRELCKQLRVAPEYLERTGANALKEIDRRRHAYTGDQAPATLVGRTAIVVDDGIATGATMLAALRATRRRGPARVIVAVPVAPSRAVDELRGEADQVLCLDTPPDFPAVGKFYRAFPQVGDAELKMLFEQADGENASRNTFTSRK